MMGPGFGAATGAQTIRFVLIALLVVAVIGAIIGYEVAVWHECSAYHPWWYCV
jgi:hypothetical protein